MPTFPNSPGVQKGALIGLDPVNPLAGIIFFQYNPETLSRTLCARTVPAGGTGGAPGEVRRLASPLEESLKFDVELDVTDRIEKADPITEQLGIHPQIASLEMRLYPKSALVIASEGLLRVGVIKVIQPEAPLAILVCKEVIF